LALTLLTLILAVAAFMGVFAVYQTLDGVVGTIESTFNYQVSAGVSDIEVMGLVQDLLSDVGEQIREVQPGVAVGLTADLTSVPEDPPDGDGETEPEERQVDLYVTGLDTSAHPLNLEYVEGDG
jgi:hypothetical protein